jgi:hypothetical protein
MKNDMQQQLDKIAAKYLGIETLQTRNSDRLDFHNISVASLQDALQQAYKAGADTKSNKVSNHTRPSKK